MMPTCVEFARLDHEHAAGAQRIGIAGAIFGPRRRGKTSTPAAATAAPSSMNESPTLRMTPYGPGRIAFSPGTASPELHYGVPD